MQHCNGMNTYTLIDQLDEMANEGEAAPDFIEQIAKAFGVRRHEVSLLRVEGSLLRFLLPEALRAAGSIPLSSDSVAARTVRYRRAEVFNSFAHVKHSRLFEAMPLGPESDGETGPIQKLMSAPVIDAEGAVVGVLQLARKGFDRATAGPDFSGEDLHALQVVASLVANMMGEIV